MPTENVWISTLNVFTSTRQRNNQKPNCHIFNHWKLFNAVYLKLKTLLIFFEMKRGKTQSGGKMIDPAEYTINQISSPTSSCDLPNGFYNLLIDLTKHCSCQVSIHVDIMLRVFFIKKNVKHLSSCLNRMNKVMKGSVSSRSSKKYFSWRGNKE